MTERWTAERAKAWYDDTPWLVGCNFTPSTAGNQLEMWQIETFDPATIDRELEWAASIGMNTVRVFLHNLLWSAEGDTYLDRIDDVLGLCAKHDITMMPVLFDGVWNPQPALGPQPQPVPNVHNSVWVQGPGATMLHDPTTWPELQRYVEAVVTRFADDARVVVWDLFNEPAQQDSETLKDADLFARKQQAVDQLVREVFVWARAASPSQPLTVGLYGDINKENDPAAGINATALELSDVVSFHSYDPGPGLEKWINDMAAHGRGVICTEWLARSAGSTVELLAVMAQRRVGAYNWGLVDGKTQTKFPWSSWWEEVATDAPWFHELFHGDGRPYRAGELDLFRQLTTTYRSPEAAQLTEEDIGDGCDFLFSQTDLVEAADIIESGVAELHTILTTLPDDQLGTRPQPGRWSVLEYAGHIRDVLLTIRDRSVLGLIQDNPGFKPLYRDERINMGLYRSDTGPALAPELLASASMLLRMAENIDPADLHRPVQYGYPGPSTRTVEWMLKQAAHEVQHHLADIKENLAQLQA